MRIIRNSIVYEKWKILQITLFGLMFGLSAVILLDNKEQFTNPQYDYVIHNLRGDVQDVSYHWNIFSEDIFHVTIINAHLVSEEKVFAIKNAILSENKVVIDNKQLHKSPFGNSTYYKGWKGAMIKAASVSDTKYELPNNFKIQESSQPKGDVIITLLNERNGDGYSGYTKTKGSDGIILQSDIIIYDVGNLSPKQLHSITLHEFGHALGLGHSSAPEDIMHTEFNPNFNHISDCNISAIIHLYNGNTKSDIDCEL